MNELKNLSPIKSKLAGSWLSVERILAAMKFSCYVLVSGLRVTYVELDRVSSMSIFLINCHHNVLCVL